MRKISILTITVLLAWVYANAQFTQALTLKELTYLQGTNLNNVTDYLSERGWKFQESGNGSSGGLDTFYSYYGYSVKIVTWSHGYDRYSGQAAAWFTLYIPEGLKSVAVYQTASEEYFTILKRSAKESKDLKYYADGVSDVGISSIYRGASVETEFKITQNYDSYGSSRNYYTVQVRNFAEVENMIKAKEEAELEAMKKAEEERKEALRQDSISRAEEMERIRLEKLAEQKREEEELNAFLKERDATTYDLYTLEPMYYSQLRSQVTSIFEKEFNSHISESFEIEGKINFQKKYTGEIAITKEVSKCTAQAQLDALLLKLQAIKLEDISRHGYPVSYKAQYPLSFYFYGGAAKIKVKKSEVKIKRSSVSNPVVIKEIQKNYATSADGKYEIVFTVTDLNGKTVSDFDATSYKEPSHLVANTLKLVGVAVLLILLAAIEQGGQQ